MPGEPDVPAVLRDAVLSGADAGGGVLWGLRWFVLWALGPAGGCWWRELVNRRRLTLNRRRLALSRAAVGGQPTPVGR